MCVAYSGGADSTALLAAAVALRARYRLQLRALHVNHHLQPGAATWARGARLRAQQWGVPCKVLDAPICVARGESPEAAARAGRYAALHGALQAGEWLLLAQHQDDQVETLLLQLLRGAGVAGLAAMPARTGVQLRPLLDVARSQLLRYLERGKVPWTEDPSNADDRYDRNYLRLKVLPVLALRWPGLGSTITRSAALAAEAQQLLTSQADTQLAGIRDGAALSVPMLRRLGAAERRNVLRRWLELQGLSMPDRSRLQEVAGPMLEARFDAEPSVRWPGGMVRRHGAMLYAMLRASATGRGSSAGENLVWDWARQPCLPLAAGAYLELRPDPHGDLTRSALPALVTVAFRARPRTTRAAQGAPAPVEGPGGKTLKRLLQETGVPPWQRSAVPLLYSGQQLLAVGEGWVAKQSPIARGDARGDAGKVTAEAAGVGAGERMRLRWVRERALGAPGGRLGGNGP